MNAEPERSASRAGSLPLVGSVLALDFCNTASGRGTAGHREHLRTAADLLTWARHAGILDEVRQARLEQRGRDAADRGAEFLTRAIGLREAIHRVNAALAAGSVPADTDIDAVARSHADCLARGRLSTREGAYAWTWAVDDAPEEAVLGPITVSAMMIITHADRARLKQCQGHHCGWLFLDTTKSNNRRWCEMEVCGNRAKQRRRRGRPEPA